MDQKAISQALIAVTLASVMLTSPMFALAQDQAEQPPCPVSPVVKYGCASWYSEDDPGIRYRTANNEVFDDSDLTCAMWNVPFNQKVRITNLANGKSIIVRVNDRGPHKRFVRKGRVVDLTKNAFNQIASLKHGLIRIRMELL